MRNQVSGEEKEAAFLNESLNSPAHLYLPAIYCGEIVYKMHTEPKIHLLVLSSSGVLPNYLRPSLAFEYCNSFLLIDQHILLPLSAVSYWTIYLSRCQ